MKDRDLRDRFVNWRQGQTVSCVVGGLTFVGTAVVIKRQADGRLFYRVRFKEPPKRTGDTVWANELPWVLGEGRYEKRCEDCGGDYRTDDVREVLCQTCGTVTVHDGSPAPYTNVGRPGPKRGRA